MNFEALLQLSPNPYLVVDRHLSIAWMNEAYLAVTMRRREDLTGRDVFDAFPSMEGSDSHALLRASFSRVLHSRRADEIALIRYDIPRPDGGMERRYWSATHTPHLDSDGEVEFILQHTVDVTETHKLRELRNGTGIVERAKAVQSRNFDLARECDWLKEVMDEAPGFMAILSGSEYRFLVANRAFRKLAGNDDILQRPLAAVLPASAAQELQERLQRVHETHEPFIGHGMIVELPGESEESIEPRVLDIVCHPITNDSGSIDGVFIAGHDVTSRDRALGRQRILIEEINHRVRNNLAVIQSLARQTFVKVPEAMGPRVAFEGRLRALACAHEILSKGNWAPLPFEQLAAVVIEKSAPEHRQRVNFEGPPVMLPAECANSLALALNELLTNAVKHGSLSCGGAVNLRWTQDDQINPRTLILEWEESGGPMPAPIAAPGFGFQLLKRTFAQDNRRSALELDPAGLKFKGSFSIPQYDHNLSEPLEPLPTVRLR